MALTIAQYPIGPDEFLTLFIGDNGSNNVTGTGGIDIFYGRGGNDRFDGQSGFDTVVFTKPMEFYELEWVGDALVVRDLSGTEGTDTLFDVEQLSFAGRLVRVDDIPRNESPSVPTDVDGSNNSVAEGAADGTAVGITARQQTPVVAPSPVRWSTMPADDSPSTQQPARWSSPTAL